MFNSFVYNQHMNLDLLLLLLAAFFGSSARPNNRIFPSPTFFNFLITSLFFCLLRHLCISTCFWARVWINFLYWKLHFYSFSVWKLASLVCTWKCGNFIKLLNFSGGLHPGPCHSMDLEDKFLAKGETVVCDFVYEEVATWLQFAFVSITCL